MKNWIDLIQVQEKKSFAQIRKTTLRLTIKRSGNEQIYVQFETRKTQQIYRGNC